MLPLAKLPSWDHAPAAGRKAVFRLFRDACARWHVTRDDGMTGGTFFTREAALRFVRREAADAAALVLHVAPEAPASEEQRQARSGGSP